MRYSLPYSAYAQIYDQIGQRAFGERMADAILNWLALRHESPKSLLDLGCGTGSASLAFARAGLNVTGIDRSPEMLERAREVADGARTMLTFEVGDMTDLRLHQTFDVVTSVYDAVNYLEDEDEFMRFARGAYRLLAPDGYLVFDMNTLYRLTTSWEQGIIVAGDSENLYVTYRSWFDAQLDASPLVVTAFVREENDHWLRFDEEHVERSWPIAAVTDWLQEVGFRIEEVTGYIDSTGDLLRPASEDHGRVVFFASR